MLRLARRQLLASPSALAFTAVDAYPPEPPARHRLAEAVKGVNFARALAADWHPYPRWDERAAWQALPTDVRQAWLDAATAQLGQAWPSLPATAMLDFKRNGNRTRFEALSFGRRIRLRQAVIGECIEGRGRFVDDILNGLWLVLEESFWGVSAHIGAQRAGVGLPDVEEPIVDLFAAETANTLAWIDYILASQLDAVSPLIRRRIRVETRRRVLEPCRTRVDFSWTGLDPEHPRYVNNWNPWINSNWLTAELILESDAQLRARAVNKIITSLDRFLDVYHDDGGCDEGPSYWGRAGASLFDCLELLYSASGGQVDLFHLPLVGAIGAYIYRAHIAGDWYTNFADASARVRPNANLVYRYGQRCGDAKLQQQGAWLGSQARQPHVEPDALGRSLDELFHCAQLREASQGARPVLERDVLLAGTQVFAARMTGGASAGFYVAAQGGHNNESHNHNDVGNFIVYYDGEPVLVDVGVETYTAKTFSAERYSIWTMQSGWHNCPTINGVEQSAGRQFEALQFNGHSDDSEAVVSLELQKAYPAAAGVERWQRQLRLDRRRRLVTLQDDFRLQRRERLEWSLITTRPMEPAGAGAVLLSGGFRIEFEPALAVSFDEHSSDDARLKPIWGPLMRRLKLRLDAPPAEGRLRLTIRKV